MVLIPGGGTVSSLVGDGDPALVRIVFGLYLITVTLIHLSALSARLPFNKTVREAATLAEFMGFVAITEVAGSVLGWNNYMWVVAATSALISAATYLAMRVGPNGR